MTGESRQRARERDSGRERERKREHAKEEHAAKQSGWLQAVGLKGNKKRDEMWTIITFF